VPEGAWQVMDAEIGGQNIGKDKQMTLGPWQFCLARKI
jgi:hypothetical protein